MDTSTSRKNEIRKRAMALLGEQGDPEGASRQIWTRVGELPEYAGARTVLFYVSRRSEVRTRNELAAALAAEDKKVVVPCCVGDELELFWLSNMDELAARTLGILEPNDEVRACPARRVTAEQLDAVVVPGVGFDRRGGRVGHGRGYYDRLLRRARPAAAVIALAYECQLFAEVPMQEHDVFMDFVVTERAVYRGRGRAGLSA